MADKFDPYREALVLEEETIWPEAFDEVEPEERARVARILHAEPAEATELEYIRTHTGFCRRITVSEADLARARESASS
ncbi:MAG: hypothetical protein DWQ31_14835 [Planctomycetota bacterium]|nr:MAG: hypothetical protein DWQ31_14835 [Planctomycetota bacterium]REJ87532.1 MAG: hypothetical protein DWQ35_21340 [Planctomycetota bacterium]REK31090.1 MAG: hypothetical protein DWQ42_01000 [Planctomycetota bacterium]REK44336.1 MAG: hypothetical protein DWQ46_10000 [Planctomycetota bacterium]